MEKINTTIATGGLQVVSGPPYSMMPHTKMTTEEKIEKRCVPQSDGCIEWVGAGKKRFPYFDDDENIISIWVRVYEQQTGITLPFRACFSHACACVNPDHMEVCMPCAKKFGYDDLLPVVPTDAGTCKRLARRRQ